MNTLKIILFLMWLPFKIFFFLIRLILCVEYDTFRVNNPEKEAELSLAFGRGNPWEFDDEDYDDDYC